MKGVKKLCCGVLLVFFIMFGLSLNASADASAVNLSTASFDLYYKSSGSSNYFWDNNIPFNSYRDVLNQGGGILQYRINTGSTTAQGNYGALHFETNIVFESQHLGDANSVWYHLEYQNIITCAASQNGVVVNSKNLSFATTSWISQDNNLNVYYNNTLTVYGDVVLAGFTTGSPVYFTCAIGSDNYSFAYIGNYGGRVYFEQNPMKIDWTNNASDSLLNIQINQYQTMLNRDEQDRNDISNQTQNSHDAAESSGEDFADAGESLLVVIGNFIQIIANPPSSDCTIDADMGNLDLGVIDLCQLSLPTPFVVIGTILLIGLCIPFAISCVRMLLYLFKEAFE